MSRVYQCIDKEVNKFNYVLEKKFNNRYKESNYNEVCVFSYISFHIKKKSRVGKCV